MNFIKIVFISIFIPLPVMGIIGCNISMQTEQTKQILKNKEKVKITKISFDDITPELFEIKQSWSAIGIDNDNNIYTGWTSLRTDGKEDTIIFKYKNNGSRSYIGSLMDTSESYNNLLTNEEIPKGHTHLQHINGKFYIGTQGFHDMKWEIEDLKNYRGSHLYSLDANADVIKDLSVLAPDGVITRNEGLIALEKVESFNLLVGLTHPMSNILLYNYQNLEVKKIIPGIPWKSGNPLSRELITTDSGKIYTYRGTENLSQRGVENYVWEYNLNTGEMKKLDFKMTGGFWIGQTIKKDKSIIYILTTHGELYQLDTKMSKFSHLGHFLPESNYLSGERIEYIYGITLDTEEKNLYAIPSRTNTGNSGKLYQFNLDNKKIRWVADLGPGIYTGSDIRDSKGYIYFGRFGDEVIWEDKCALLKIKVDN